MAVGSGSLGFVITACKAVCLWAELLLRGQGRPHRYIWGGGKQQKAKMMKGKEAEEEREMGQGLDGAIAKGGFYARL